MKNCWLQEKLNKITWSQTIGEVRYNFDSDKMKKNLVLRDSALLRICIHVKRLVLAYIILKVSGISNENKGLAVSCG